MNNMNTSLRLVLLAVATLMQGCAAQWPNCPHRDNICNVAMRQIHTDPDKYKPDLIKRTVIDVRSHGAKTGITLETR
jgi:hypothetical protein